MKYEVGESVSDVTISSSKLKIEKTLKSLVEGVYYMSKLEGSFTI